MNLGIEYLVRTGTIRNFLQVPCSVFLETEPHRSKVVVTLENHRTHQEFTRHYLKVTRWDLNQLEDDPNNILGKMGLPARQEHQVLESEVFNSDVLEGNPIHYKERPIETHCNHYAHPMDENTYDYFLSNYLNSEYHKSSRMTWLWRAFVKLNFSAPLLELRYYERRYSSQIMECEQFIVIEYDQPKWKLWHNWERKLLKSKTVAAELIFQKITSSSSSSS